MLKCVVKSKNFSGPNYGSKLLRIIHNGLECNSVQSNSPVLQCPTLYVHEEKELNCFMRAFPFSRVLKNKDKSHEPFL